MKTAIALATLAVVGASGLAAPRDASANLLTNGDFETGSFAGWTVTDQIFGAGTWFVDAPGTTTPSSVGATSGAGGLPHGSFYAVSDQGDEGTHVLTQSFTVAPGATVTFSFDWFVNDTSGSGGTVNAAGLDFTAFPNQHARVDILTGAASAFDTGAGVLANFYLGVDPSASIPNPFIHYVFDISAVVAAGGTFQVRFAEVDNRGNFNAGVDNVSVTVASEPATLTLLSMAFVGLGLAWRRRSVA